MMDEEKWVFIFLLGWLPVSRRKCAHIAIAAIKITLDQTTLE
jgi:hypothetical protein